MAKYLRSVELMEAEVGDEIVALDAARGTCFGFNGVASSVWRALAKPQTFEMLRDGLLTDYDVDRDRCEFELTGLLADLETKGLIRQVVS